MNVLPAGIVVQGLFEQVGPAILMERKLVDIRRYALDELGVGEMGMLEKKDFDAFLEKFLKDVEENKFILVSWDVDDEVTEDSVQFAESESVRIYEIERDGNFYLVGKQVA